MIQVLLVGPDDVLPHGKMRVNFRDCPRVGELIVWEKRSAANEYFRVTEVCWIFTGGVPQRMNALTKKPQLKNSGYLYVLFGRDMHYVAHLVLTAFVGPRPPGKECCHNDGNKLNNAVENLRWDTRSENVRDIVRHGNHPQAEKEACSSGHPFDADNTYNRPNGARDCKECTRARGRKYRRRLRIEGEAA